MEQDAGSYGIIDRRTLLLRIAGMSTATLAAHDTAQAEQFPAGTQFDDLNNVLTISATEVAGHSTPVFDAVVSTIAELNSALLTAGTGPYVVAVASNIILDTPDTVTRSLGLYDADGVAMPAITINKAKVIPSTVSIVFVQNGAFTVQAGTTLVQIGSVMAGPRHHIFRGAGTVRLETYPPEVHPGWWGILPRMSDGDSSVDQAPLFQKMLDSLAYSHTGNVGDNLASNTRGARVVLMDGIYRLDSLVHFRSTIYMAGNKVNTKFDCRAVQAQTEGQANGGAGGFVFHHYNTDPTQPQTFFQTAYLSKIADFTMIGAGGGTKYTHSGAFDRYAGEPIVNEGPKIRFTKGAYNANPAADGSGNKIYNAPFEYREGHTGGYTLTVGGLTLVLADFDTAAVLALYPYRIIIRNLQTTKLGQPAMWTNVDTAVGPDNLDGAKVLWKGTEYTIQGWKVEGGAGSTNRSFSFVEDGYTPPDVNDFNAEMQIVALPPSFDGKPVRFNHQHAIDARTQIDVTDVGVTYFDGHAFVFDSSRKAYNPDGSVNGSIFPNTDNSRLIGPTAVRCLGAGFHSKGLDANNITVINSDFRSCAIAFYDEPQHGNTFIAPHVAECLQGLRSGYRSITPSTWYSPYVEGGWPQPELGKGSLIVLGSTMFGPRNNGTHVTPALLRSLNLLRHYVPRIDAAAYTITADDNGKVLSFFYGTDVTVAVPAGLPDGFNVKWQQAGDGRVTFKGVNGATVNNVDRHSKSRARFAEGNLAKIAPGLGETYVLSGATGA
jgi:hypothetical protein